jgi:hypothetical protein
MQQLVCLEDPAFGSGEQVDFLSLKILTDKKQPYAIFLLDDMMRMILAGTREEAKDKLNTNEDTAIIPCDELRLDAAAWTARLMNRGREIYKHKLFQIIPFQVKTDSTTFTVHPFLGAGEIQLVWKMRTGGDSNTVDFTPPKISEGRTGTELRISAAGMTLYAGTKLIASTFKVEA